MLRLLLPIISFIAFPCLLMAQGTPPMDPNGTQVTQAETQGTPPVAPAGPIQHVEQMVKSQVKQAIMSNPYPVVDRWQPLTAKQKFRVFLDHTYAPSTFVNAGIDSV